MIRPGFPIDVIVTVAAAAREVDGISSGVDKFHFFECRPMDYRPVASGSDKFQGGAVMGTEAKPMIGRNVFFEEMPVDAELTVLVGADGICTVVRWLC